MKELPTILVTPAFTFVHGGLVHEKLEDNFQLPPFQLLKNDNFINQGKHFDKYVVVGHWPCAFTGRISSPLRPISARNRRLLPSTAAAGSSGMTSSTP